MESSLRRCQALPTRVEKALCLWNLKKSSHARSVPVWDFHNHLAGWRGTSLLLPSDSGRHYTGRESKAPEPQTLREGVHPRPNP